MPSARPPFARELLRGLDCASRASAFAGTAVHAPVRVDDELGVAFADSLAGAGFLARAALDAVIADYMSHGFLLVNTSVLPSETGQFRNGSRPEGMLKIIPAGRWKSKTFGIISLAYGKGNNSIF